MTLVTDYVPASNKAIRDGSPDRLAVIARLFGHEPVAPERCSVLEIGCGEGVHLVPLAELAPESRFVGVDLDPRAVERGNEAIARLGLSNVTLKVADFREISGKNERFDYVVAHGVYSWVSADVRDALLSLVAEALDDEGVAYLSFNTLPGHLARELVRELVLPHVRSLGEPAARIARAREVVKELLRMPPQPGTSFALLRGELEHFARSSDSLLHHDYLAEVNHGVTLPELAEHLARHGLEYVTDANHLDRSPFVEHPLAKTFETPLERAAYADRLEMQRFRQAVVRRKRAASPVLEFVRGERLWVASSAEPAARGDVKGNAPVRFKTLSGVELETTVPEGKLALYELGRVWPEALRLDDLAERVSEHLGTMVTPSALAKLFFESAASLAVRAFFRPPRSVHAVSRTPTASASARLDAAGARDVTNLHHEPVKFDVPFHRELLSLLDGTRDRERLIRDVSDAIEAGRVVVSGVDPKARASWEALMGREVDAGLARFARYALLTG